MTPLAITGVGIATSAGVGKDLFFQAIASGEPGTPFAKENILSFDASAYDALNVLEVPEFDPALYLGDKGLRTLDRITKLLVVGARICLHDARIKVDNAFVKLAAEDVGFLCSNAYGSLEAITELDRVALLEDFRYINPAKFPNTVSNSAAGYVSIWEDLRALNVSISNGNTGALDAFGMAEIHLTQGRASALITGGGEAMCEALFLAFRKLGALTDRCLGEGVALFATELDEAASARGANVIGHVRGYGTHFSGPDDDRLIYPSELAMKVAATNAIADAGLHADEIDLVVTGASGIKPFDRAERSAIESVLSDGAREQSKNVAIVSPKRIFGETFGAGGGIGVGVALHAVSGGALPMLESGLFPAQIRCVLVTSMGYYGNASAVVITR